MTVIEVEGLHKQFRIPHEKKTTLFEALTGFYKPNSYETLHALKDINFSVDEGELFGIIGINGSGKSTLLKILANIMQPTAGKVDVRRQVTPFLELGVGFQPEYTAIENIKTYATIMGMKKREIEDKTDEILEFSGLEKFRDAKLKTFSSGMQVKLAFSTAIQANPEILLLDEVLAVGDMEFQQKCLDVLNNYRKDGVTIVFVSHDLGSIRRFCDRTLLLRNGEQVALGETNEMIDSYIYGEREGAEALPDEESGVPATGGRAESRWGNRKVEITGVGFFDKFGSEAARFNTFDSMTIRIFYEAHERVQDPVFGIALYSDQGIHLYGTTTELQDVTTGLLEGRGHIDLVVEQLPMLAGHFLLTVAIHTHDHKPYDWRDREYSFDVVATGRDDGLFAIPCRWRL